MNLTSIKNYVKAGVAVLLAATIYAWGYSSSETKWETKWSIELLRLEEAKTAALEQARQKEYAYQLDREEAERHLQAGIDSARADATAFNKRADSLQQQLANTKRNLSEAAKLAGVNQGATKAALVLSDLLSEATEELGRVAGTADEWYVKASSCEKFYDNVKAR